MVAPESFFYRQKQSPEFFCIKAVLKNFSIFTRKHLCWSLFLIKLQTFRSLDEKFYWKRLEHGCFSMSIAKFLRILISRNICEWLLLHQSELFMFHYSNVVFLLFTVLERDSTCDAILSLIFIFFCYILILLANNKQNTLTLF